MTPLQIEVLLKSYYSTEPLEKFFDSPAGADAIEHFRCIGLIDEHYRATEKGRAHISQLCRLPFPRQGWIDAHGTIIPVDPL